MNKKEAAATGQTGQSVCGQPQLDPDLKLRAFLSWGGKPLRLESALANVYTGELSLVEDVALITYATPRAPDLTLLAPLRAPGLHVVTIGDCRMPRGVAAATAEGYAAAIAL